MPTIIRTATILLGTICLASAALPATVGSDALAVDINQQGHVTAMRIGGTALSVTPAPLVELCDAADGQFVAPIISGNAQTGLAMDFAKLQATGLLKIVPVDGRLQFSVGIKGADLPARGMLLRLSFPFDADGWRWHQDMQTSEAISRAKVYENVVPLRAWADLPEWKDQPDLRMGYSNRNFLTVLTGPVGLCLSVPMDRPCTFRTAYDGPNSRLQMVYDFALSPDTAKPNEVSFVFDLHPCDPHWAYRSALARYYRAYPQFFEVFIRDQGQWMAFSRLSEIDNANEFYFALQEGAPETEYDDKIGVLSTIYLTHAGQFARIPDYDPETQPLPPFDRRLAAMVEAFRKTTGDEKMYEKVGLHTAEGQLNIVKTAVYGHIIAQFNLDPDLDYGAWTLKHAGELTENIKQRSGGELDGFYYDGLSAGINYRPDHFKTALQPCLWDPVAQKPFINNFYSSVEFARAAAEQLRPKGQITMMNGAEGSSFFIAPWLDVLGAETGLRISRHSLNYIRSVTHHKPFMTLLKGNYEQTIGYDQMELFMKRCVAYGIFPGFFDWPPSGLGPGSRYWDHSRYYERDRDLFRKYQPLCKALALAGWEPVTYARSSEPSVYVERYGPADGVVWLTLLNEEARPHATRLSIDARGLGLDPAAVQAVDVLSGRAVELTRAEGGFGADLEVPADGVIALQLAAPEASAKWRAAMALETVQRGSVMRRADAQKPPVPAYWVPKGTAPGRESLGEQQLMVLGEGMAQTCPQWAMLFQPDIAPVTLKVRVAGEGIEGGKAAVDCRIAWVTSSFTHYETRTFDLPTGTYDLTDLEFTIEAEHALRSIQLIPTRTGKGKLKFARISLSDANREEYVIDPSFEQWYEPVPDALRGRIDADYSALGSALAALVAGDAAVTSEAVRTRLVNASGICSALRTAISEQQAESGCRRVLRDIETVERHLGFVTLAAFGIAPPKVNGPVTAAPGDRIELTVAMPHVAGLPTATQILCNALDVTPTATGGAVQIPPDAEIGTIYAVDGLVHIGPAGKAVAVRASHQITVMPPLELELTSSGIDTETGAARIAIRLHNNRLKPVNAGLTVTPPDGWRVSGPATVQVGPGGDQTVETQIAATGGAEAGMVELSVAAKSGADEAFGRLSVLYIPKEANLIRNPGFEEGADAWGMDQAAASIATDVARSGSASLKIANPTVLSSQCSQGVTLNQQQPCAILVRASSKAVDVSGARNREYSLYVDIYYTDGTPLYGQTYQFETGTTDWQLGELYIEPAKPIRNVNVYLLLRGKSGTAYFDDVAVMEDPRRKGNIARDAEITVDSNYGGGYSPAPITDGIIQADDLHWTEAAWASAENDQAHFITLKLPEPRSVAKLSIYWSLDAGLPRTSRLVQVQVRDGDAWRTVKEVLSTERVPMTQIVLDEPVSAAEWRLLQPPNQGSPQRTGLMWVREVELLAPAQ